MRIIDIKIKEKDITELKSDLKNNASINVGELKKFLQNIPDNENISFSLQLKADYVNLKDTHLTDMVFQKTHTNSVFIYDDGSEKERISDSIGCTISAYTCKVYEVREW